MEHEDRKLGDDDGDHVISEVPTAGSVKSICVMGCNAV
jgi:hypothetical protein